MQARVEVPVGVVASVGQVVRVEVPVGVVASVGQVVPVGLQVEAQRLERRVESELRRAWLPCDPRELAFVTVRQISPPMRRC